MYQDSVNQAPIIDYSLLIQTEHYSLKNAFYIAKTLLQKIEKNENFLKIDSRYFNKYKQCHDKYADILTKDLQRISTQYFLTQTQLQNQGVEQLADPIEAQYFIFKRNSFNQLQEANSMDESENNQSRKGNILQLKQKQVSHISSQNPTVITHTLQTNIPLKVQETCSLSAASKNSPTLVTQQNPSKISFLNELQIDQNNQIPQEMEVIPNKIELNKNHLQNLLQKYKQNLMKVFQKLQNQYTKKNGSDDHITKVVKLALRIAMCLRHSDVFDKSQMEQILLYFQKSDQNFLQVVQTPNTAYYNMNNPPSSNINNPASSNLIQGNSNPNNWASQNLQVNNPNNLMINSYQKVSTPSLGTSLANSKNLKKQTNSGQMQFSIESLVQWVDKCSKSEALRQISILIKE